MLVTRIRGITRAGPAAAVVLRHQGGRSRPLTTSTTTTTTAEPSWSRATNSRKATASTSTTFGRGPALTRTEHGTSIFEPTGSASTHLGGRRYASSGSTGAIGHSCSLGAAAGEARIVVVADDDDRSLVELERLPAEATILFRGATSEDFFSPEGKKALAEANVLLFCAAPDVVRQLVPLAPKLVWVHSTMAGIDGILSPEFTENDGISLTNASGMYSPSLSEHCLLSCLYFAKDVDRWKRNQKMRKWEQYDVTQISGATLGVIGYGDIGKSSARKAKAMGMKVIAQRRRPELFEGDGIADQMFGPGQVGELIAQSDYILVSAALTPETIRMVGAEELARAKPHAVIINLGRGAIIDEGAMTAMLQDGRLRGAALDVFEVEPLSTESPLWGLENVLLSPHNVDMTAEYIQHRVRCFVGSVPSFVKGEKAPLHLVDKREGY